MPFLDSSGSLLEPKYDAAYNEWKTSPNPTTTGRLLRVLQPEIDRGIFAHVGTSANPILKSKAKQFALGAIKSYDPTKASLGTHVVNQLQSLKRAMRQQGQIVSIPERVVLDQGYVERAKIELEESLGREPSNAELADHTGISLKRLNYISKYKYPMSEGSFDNMIEDSDGSFSPAVNSAIGDKHWLEFVYSDLDPVNQKIMEWTFGLHGSKKYSNEMIARKLKITPGAVSQRKQKIQTILDNERLNPFLGL